MGKPDGPSGGTRGIEKILDKWRGLIKSKKRMIISLEEIIQAKIESVRPWIVADREPLTGWQHRHFRYDRHGQRTWTDDDWQPIDVGGEWGGPDMSCYFKRDGARIPARFRGQPVCLRAYFSGDGLLRVNGQAYHGMDPFRDLVNMTDAATGDEVYDLEVESYIAWHFGEGTVKTVEVSEWVVLDAELEEAYWDLRAAFNLLVTEGLPSDLTAYLRDVLHQATKPLEQEGTDRVRVRQLALAARAMVRERIYESDRFRRDGMLNLCGNSHLDLVYLWTHAEYDRKIGRTHATALRMMELYPEYIFSQSQPQMYDRMRTLYPELYEQVKTRIAEGRWEAIGAFWVEPDCNLISGESMVRQLLHGIRFYRQEFGVTPRTAWIPDVFGNAWSMPQILVKAGLEYFVTHKMNVWNDTNKWTRHVFWWEGPDGSRIFATVPPTHFIGVCEPDHLNDHWDQYSAQAEVPESLYCYGWGDGGGGPDREMLEYCKRYRDMPGVVPSRFSRIEDALARMHGYAAARDDIPVINDELYLEEHRGVYTTKGRLKKLNRRLEYLLRDAEMLSVLAAGPYPAADLDVAWKQLLTTQFHDSLPGTHVPPAYLDILEMLDDCRAKAEAAVTTALATLAPAPSANAADGAEICLQVFNTEPRPRTRLVEWPCDLDQAHVLGPDNAEIPSQFSESFETGDRVLVFPATVPACGQAFYRILPTAGAATADNAAGSDHVLENDHLRVEFDGRGEIVSLFDKHARRECIEPGRRGNVFQLFEDLPGTFDAWDIEMHYEDTEFELEPGTVSRGESGPVFSSLVIRKPVLGSSLVQRVRLARDARRLEFETRIDWKERHKLLKVRFHTAIRSRTATYDIAYANIDRPTTRNNSFETARFEVPGHEWMDLGQPDHGLSLLTDSKYGYECRDGRLGLSLLKGPMYPDPTSDIEEHRFSYALYPHAGNWRAAGTIEEASDLNIPFHARQVAAAADPAAGSSFLVLGEPGIKLEALKRAEDGSGDIVMRLVERLGRQVTLAVTCPAPAAAAAHDCDLLEQPGTELALADGTVSLTLDPYEIKTVRFAGGSGTRR